METLYRRGTGPKAEQVALRGSSCRSDRTPDLPDSGHKVILDRDLAELYQVPTKGFNQAVRRNKERFPDNFLFQVSNEMFDYIQKLVELPKKPKGQLGFRISSESVAVARH